MLLLGRIVAALIRRTGDWDLSEECAQEAFAQALTRWPADGVPDRPGAWLTTVAKNRAIDRLRRERRGAELLEHAAPEEAEVQGMDEHVDESGIVRNIPGFADPQQRVIAVTVEGVRIISAYFPNGQAPGTEKFAYKLRWLDALHDWVASEMAQHPKLALLGDYNIAPDDRDVHDPKAWEGQNLVSPEERAAKGR